ncbi:MAG: MarC family protein [Verrucomicrobiales bacterium]
MTLATAFLMLLFLMDPFGNMATFHAVLARVPEEKRRWVLVRELLFAYGLLVVFLFSGEAVMRVMGLKQPAINVAGGVVLFLIAIEMVFPTRGLKAADETEEPFIVPLALPLIAGPSTIASVLLLVSKHPGRHFEWWIALTAAWAVMSGILLASGWLLPKLGPKGTRALEKLTGMLLIMLAIQMLLDGVAQALELSR